jgi:hypothetical protein
MADKLVNDLVKEAEKNALLLNAAPDLLAACKAYLASGSGMFSRHWRMMKIAVAKAEGKPCKEKI